MRVDDLKAICRKFNIHQGKKKATFVENVLQRVRVQHRGAAQLAETVRLLRDFYLVEPAPLHDFYKDYFNLVDLVDRRWNAVEHHHAIFNWKTKMTLILLRLGVYNAWAMMSAATGIEWLQFRETLAAQLVAFA
eukprot:TRINITY_DN7520_c0_g1_i2.p1 TRINITY_DN7520_c0_g1~~TRINITY_DN7520_c0_g1_i2.p1  ORF type:complete len:153 (-),score=33.93 TRINITY_DN7520_c0_g1_i2:25-426(-)